MFRKILLALSLAALCAPTTFSQSVINCVGGMAGGFPCNEINLASHLTQEDLEIPVDPSTGEPYRNNDIWGWTDSQNGNEFALMGNETGLYFVDVTVPTAPIYLGTLPTQTSFSVWRDVKTYQNHAFIVADGAGSHGLQVFDLTRLRNVTSPPETFTADAIYSGIGSAHNVAINEDTGYAYIVGSDCNGGLHMVNIQNPTSPMFAGCFEGDGSTHDAQCVTYTGPDTDYVGHEICVGAQGWTGHIVVVDVTDKANPIEVSIGNYTDSTYAHQGWFTEDQRYFLLGDEIDDNASATTRTMVFDMSDLDNPELHFYYYGPIETTDHNLYIRGHYAFMSNYTGGLRIVDIEEIDNGTMTEVAFFDTYPTDDAESYNGQWSNYPYFESGNIIANDRDFGLFVLTPNFPIGTSNEIVEAPGAEGYALSSANPNPFASDTRLTLTLAETQHVQAEMLDITGRRVALLHDGVVRAGATFLLTLTAASLPSGLYLVRVRGEHFTATRRVSLVH